MNYLILIEIIFSKFINKTPNCLDLTNIVFLGGWSQLFCKLFIIDAFLHNFMVVLSYHDNFHLQ
jgi:hypothetical protein